MNAIVKNILGVLWVCLFVLGSLVIVGAQGSSVPLGTFAGGKGTEQSPYLIKTKQQLAAVGKFTGEPYKGLCFKQVADIIFTEKDFAPEGEFYNNGQGWIPIGHLNNTLFMGTFDGGMKMIQGLKITQNTTPQVEVRHVGLFSRGAACVLKNIILKDYDFSVSFARYINVGAIVGAIEGGNIASGKKSLVTHNYAEGKIHASFFAIEVCAGGIVGGNFYYESVMSHNVVRADITADNKTGYPPYGILVGGICGKNGGVISYNMVSGNLISPSKSRYPDSSTTPCIGGVVGLNERTGVVSQNYAEVALTTTKSAGGIVGENQGKIANNVSLCPSINTINDTKYYVGRVWGNANFNSNSIIVRNNYALAALKISPEAQWTLDKGGAKKDGEDFLKPNLMSSWKEAGFVFGKTAETPWVMSKAKGKAPALYWLAKALKNITGNSVESIVVEKGSPLEKMQQQFLSRKELMEKATQESLEALFVKNKGIYEQKLNFIFDNYVKQNKLEESLPIQEMLEALKAAKNLDDLPLLALPVHAEKEKKEFETLLGLQSQAVVSQKKAEYMAFKEKYMAALTRLKAKLIGEKDVKNALVVEQEIKAMKADTGESFEELAPSAGEEDIFRDV